MATRLSVERHMAEPAGMTNLSPHAIGPILQGQPISEDQVHSPSNQTL